MQKLYGNVASRRKRECKMKMNKETTITVKVELSEEEIKECFIKAMEQMIEELKQNQLTTK